MQSPEIASVDRECVETQVHAYFEQLAAATDFSRLMAFVADQVDFERIGNRKLFPQADRLRGKDVLAQARVTIDTRAKTLGSTLEDRVIDGDRIALGRTTRPRSLVGEFTEIVESLAIARLEEC